MKKLFFSFFILMFFNTQSMYDCLFEDYYQILKNESLVENCESSELDLCVTKNNLALTTDCSEKILNNNIKQFHSDKNFMCKHCNRQFFSKTGLTKHVNNAHLKFKGSCNPTDDLVIFYCPYQNCNQTFNNIVDLFTHKKEMHGAYECSFCRYVLDTKKLLIEHLHLHTEKKYPCPHCYNLYVRKDSLERHFLKEHIDKLPICEHCNNAFPSEERLRKHSLYEHPEYLVPSKRKKT